MRKIFLSFCTLTTYLVSHAQINLHNDVSPRQAKLFLRSMPLSELDNYVEKNGATLIRRNGDLNHPGLTAVTSQTEYKWSFEKTPFFSYIKAFRTNLTPPPSCLSSAPQSHALTSDDCADAIRQFVQCHLFVISSSRKLIAVQPLYIPQPDFIEAKPGCFDVYAMAPAKVVKDGMLIVAGYYDSRWTCFAGPACASDGPAASPDPLYKTTFLVRFSKDSDGNLVLRQDDECLAPLNEYATIASARRALIDNGCH